MTDTLIQTRLPPDMAGWLRQQAETEGEAQSSWLRRLIYRAAGRVHLDAWVCPKGCDVNAVHAADETPTFDLEVIERRSAVELIAAAYLPDGQGPVTELGFRESDLFQKTSDCCVVIRGNPHPCAILVAAWDTTTRRLELTLKLGSVDDRQRLLTSGYTIEVSPTDDGRWCTWIVYDPSGETAAHGAGPSDHVARRCAEGVIERLLEGQRLERWPLPETGRDASSPVDEKPR